MLRLLPIVGINENDSFQIYEVFFLESFIIINDITCIINLYIKPGLAFFKAPSSVR